MGILKRNPNKLSRKQKKEINTLVSNAKGDGMPHSAQDSIPYEIMYEDGICKLDHIHYSKCIEFDDINYQLAGNEDKDSIFESLCDFYNYFDSSVSIQISLISKHSNKEELEKMIEIKEQDDEFNSIRNEYRDMLRNQQSRGNNGLVKTKYITFTVVADNLKAAKSKLSRIEIDVLNRFKLLGANARVLNGKARLASLHGMMHPDGDKFVFNYKSLPESGLSTKDYIAPSSFNFSETKQFRMGDKVGCVSFMNILAAEMNDRLLKEYMEAEDGVILSIHIRSIDQVNAIKMIKRKITDLDSMKIQEQKKAVRSGYDMDIIPSDLATYGGEAKTMLRDLQSKNEKLFNVTFLVMNYANNPRKLNSAFDQSSGIAQSSNNKLIRLDYQQEQGFVSCLPLGINQVPISRGLTTSSTAIFVPFTTQELFQSGESLYYGLNQVSNNMIMADRKKLKNPNGLILGTPGSGKSFSAKREITNAFLITEDDIIICDPEAEYYPLVERLKGQVIKISPVSKQYVNPMDINMEEDNPISLKSDFVLSFCEIIAGGKSGLEPVEKTVIDRAVRTIYTKYLQNPSPDNMPILEDLYNEIKKQPEQQAQRVAAALELYVHGSLNVFNHRTNVDIHNRLVCFDIKELGKQLKQLGMLVIQDQVWNRVALNRSHGKSTRYYIDEFHLLLRGEVASWSVEIWKRFRKWGGIPTGITQNIKDFLASPEVENIFENSDFIYMLNQASGDRQILAKQLNISAEQMKYIEQVEAGEGLIFYGDIIIPFVDRFPEDTELYRIMTTKPNEVNH